MEQYKTRGYLITILEESENGEEVLIEVSFNQTTPKRYRFICTDNRVDAPDGSQRDIEISQNLRFVLEKIFYGNARRNR